MREHWLRGSRPESFPTYFLPLLFNFNPVNVPHSSKQWTNTHQHSRWGGGTRHPQLYWRHIIRKIHDKTVSQKYKNINHIEILQSFKPGRSADISSHTLTVTHDRGGLTYMQAQHSYHFSYNSNRFSGKWCTINCMTQSPFFTDAKITPAFWTFTKTSPMDAEWEKKTKNMF